MLIWFSSKLCTHISQTVAGNGGAGGLVLSRLPSEGPWLRIGENSRVQTGSYSSTGRMWRVSEESSPEIGEGEC